MLLGRPVQSIWTATRQTLPRLERPGIDQVLFFRALHCSKSPLPLPANGLLHRSLSSTPGAEDVAPAQKSILSQFKDGTWPSALSKESMELTADQITSSTRWWTFPKVFMIQVPTGAVYAWSVWQAALTQEVGIVASCSSDWGLPTVAFTFSCLAAGYGTNMLFLAPWVDRAGPKLAGCVSGSLFGLGHLISAVGCYFHSIPLIWGGVGYISGLGWGMGFVAPIATLLKWFPDKKGFATGASISAFGLGAFFVSPLIDFFRAKFFKAPTYAGAKEVVETMTTEGGIQMVKYNGDWHESVFATATELAKLPGGAGSQMLEGYYLAGTGDNGCMMSLLALGLLSTATMNTGALMLTNPSPGWMPEGYTPPAATTSQSASGSSSLIASGNVLCSTAIKTPQFWLLWTTLACNCSAGIAILASAKMMVGDVFGNLYPTIVTASFTTSFVGILSVANSAGRVGWSGVSDHIGRKNTYFICCASVPLCFLMPTLAHSAADMGPTSLYLFYGSTCAMISWYGGGLALMPSYAADLFGVKEAGIIFSRLMTGWAASAIISPNIVAYLRSESYNKAISDLVGKIPPEAFEKSFGAPINQLDTLVQSKTVTIPRLLEISPMGTQDPTPFLYDSTFYTFGGVLSIVAVANALIRRVDEKHYIEEASHKEAPKSPSPAAPADPAAKEKIADPAKFVRDVVGAGGISVFAKTYCPHCQKALSLLKEENADMTVYQLDEYQEPANGPVQQELNKITGTLSVPQIFVGGNFIGGASDIEKLKANGKLKEALQ